MDMVVHPVERMLPGKLHFPGVVLAGRNALELVERDVYVAQVDRHGLVSLGFLNCFLPCTL
jgi:hypothetical protein